MAAVGGCAAKSKSNDMYLMPAKAMKPYLTYDIRVAVTFDDY